MSRLWHYALGFLLVAGSLLSSGCNNLSPRDNVSPRLQQQIDNHNGKIDRIESNQNAIKLEMSRRNDNSGVQIFQGDGGLLLAFGIVVILCVTFYFYRSSARNEKMVFLLAEQIKSYNDPNLEEHILKAAMYTEVEKDIFYHITRRT
jgi:hypothetical protein